MYYYAVGSKVPSIRFDYCEDAWDFVDTHKGYDCVVESHS